MATSKSSTLQDTDKKRIAFNLLKINGVKVDTSKGGIRFIVPPKLEKMIKDTFGFSMDMLSVGGNLALADLAVHLDEQPSLECHLGSLAEFYRYHLQNENDMYEMWYNETFYKCRKRLIENGEKAPAEKVVVGRMMIAYGKEYRRRREDLNYLEFEYRLLNNAVRSAVITKGTMLPTLRNIIQGKNGDGIEQTFDGNDKLRKSIKIKRNDKNAQEKSSTDEKDGKTGRKKITVKGSHQGTGRKTV